jgi:lipoprotein-anchoring transpeptidase ErfK/SrfK
VANLRRYDETTIIGEECFSLATASVRHQASIPETYRRHIVDYMRKEQPGTILVDSNARYLYYVLPGGKAIRYGVTVGEEV